jgi:DNA-nicking Smr family endonuclease
MSKRDGRKRPGLSQDERVLWSTVTRSIAPLRQIPAEPDIEAESVIAETPRRTARKAKAPAVPAASLNPALKPMPPPLTPLSRRMRRSVGRGKEAIDARLDLHGLTQSEAHSSLLRFLRDASAREARLVLVITGKGANLGARGEGAGERGVLKRQVPHWLALPEFRALVIGFEDAGVRHGGEGALYVRLRRMRD